MWPLVDGVAGIMIGCAISLIILAIRISASRAVVTWRTSAPDLAVREPEHEMAGQS